MAILIDIGMPEWMSDEQVRDKLAPLLPGVTIYCGRPDRDLSDVTMLALADSVADIWSWLPNLALVQKLGAGVNTILDDPKLPPHVRVTRLTSGAQAQEIAEYCLAYVLRHQRNMGPHETDAVKRRWNPIAPRRTEQTTVGVLGLGHIGARTARLFVALGFRVLGWSRSPKSIKSVECQVGEAALPDLLSECDYVASILPSTPQTCNLFDAALIARMKPGCVLINVGRGDLIVEEALISALNSGQLGGAVLDVFRQEPLPPDHPFWDHLKITITPHISGWHVEGGFEDVAENYLRLTGGRSLLHEIDRNAGY